MTKADVKSLRKVSNSGELSSIRYGQSRAQSRRTGQGIRTSAFRGVDMPQSHIGNRHLVNGPLEWIECEIGPIVIRQWQRRWRLEGT